MLIGQSLSAVVVGAEAFVTSHNLELRIFTITGVVVYTHC